MEPGHSGCSTHRSDDRHCCYLTNLNYHYNLGDIVSHHHRIHSPTRIRARFHPLVHYCDNFHQELERN